jgi:hypothetical protein
VLQFVAGYQTNLAVPHNVQGIRLADQLQGLVGQSLDSRIVEVENPVVVRRGTDIAEMIRQAKGKFLVLNFSMHCGVDDDGPFLFVDDADSSDAPGNRIRISEILSILEKQPSNQVKVVLFDAEQNETLWTFGVLDNRFGHALQLLQDKIQNVPNLLVVNACGRDGGQDHTHGQHNHGDAIEKATEQHVKQGQRHDQHHWRELQGCDVFGQMPRQTDVAHGQGQESSPR